MNKEEAIKVLNSRPYTGEVREALETLIPELKESEESEEERVRKDIIGLIKFALNDGSAVSPGSHTTKEEALAYLEKQKEQPQEELVYRLNGLMQEYVKEGKDEAEKEHRFKCYQLFWDALEDANFFEQKEQKPAEINVKALLAADRLASAEMTGRLKERSEILENPEKYGLQKPAEWDELQAEFRNINEAFEDGKKEVVAHPEKYGLCKPADEQFPPLEGLDAIKAKYYDDGFKNGFDEGADSVKPTEWSEEDEKMRKEIELVVSGVGITVAGMRSKMLRWLKSLRPSWKPSEEELVALKRVGGILRDYGHSELAKTVFMIEGKLANLSIINKSIWKPSEEQKEALRAAFTVGNLWNIPWVYSPLKELYEQLKKLM